MHSVTIGVFALTLIVLFGYWLNVISRQDSNSAESSASVNIKVSGGRDGKYDQMNLNRPLPLNKSSRPTQQSSSSKRVDLLEQLLRRSHSDITTERNDAQVALARYYAEFDPAAGLEWLSTLDPLGNSQGKYLVFGSEIAKFSPSKWQELAGKIIEKESRDSYLKGAIFGVGESSPQVALELIARLFPSESDAGALRKGLISHVARLNPEAAINLFDFRKEPELVKTFYQRVEFKSAEDAVLSFEKIVDPALRNECMTTYVSGAGTDMKLKLGNAILNEGGDSRDLDLYNIAKALYYEDLAGSIPLVLGIKDQALRNDIVRKLSYYADSKGDVVSRKVRVALNNP